MNKSVKISFFSFSYFCLLANDDALLLFFDSLFLSDAVFELCSCYYGHQRGAAVPQHQSYAFITGFISPGFKNTDLFTLMEHKKSQQFFRIFPPWRSLIHADENNPELKYTTDNGPFNAAV